MGQEIERKFLVDLELLGALEDGQAIQQGYIDTVGKVVVRARLAGDSAWLTLKGANVGAVRSEFEYPVPADDAREIIAQLCHGPVIAKTRYLRDYEAYTWEIDVFEGDNEGLVVAEVELQVETDQPPLPQWVTREVTGDSRYYNNSLAQVPWRTWPDKN
jgi:adenylate cyclase